MIAPASHMYASWGMGAKSCSWTVSKVKIKSWTIIYFAISPDGKVCWANVCKDEQRYRKQKQKKNKHVALDNLTLDAI